MSIINFFKKISKETITGIIFIAFGILLVIEGTKITVFDSAILVYLTLALYFAMGLLITISGVMGKNNKPMESFFYKRKELMLLVLLFLYQFLVKNMDFYILTLPFVFCTNLTITWDFSKKNLLNSVFFSVLLVAGVYLICNYGLNIII